MRSARLAAKAGARPNRTATSIEAREPPAVDSGRRRLRARGGSSSWTAAELAALKASVASTLGVDASSVVLLPSGAVVDVWIRLVVGDARAAGILSAVNSDTTAFVASSFTLCEVSTASYAAE